MPEEYPYLERYLIQFAPYSIERLQAMAARGCSEFNDLVRPSALEAVSRLLAEQGMPIPEPVPITAATAITLMRKEEKREPPTTPITPGELATPVSYLAGPPTVSKWEDYATWVIIGGMFAAMTYAVFKK